ncbi:FYN-binding protein [Oryzias melastigma]|uniref:FYN-binding protein n=1 Tax=Oryzias melastigma TaxID=30732 RepID=A0A834KWT6_ORYME|nr:FYN-binding protein [Oryzias melastigma]
MGEAVDVKALRAKFSTSDTSSRDSGSPKSPRPAIGRAILPLKELELALKLPLAGHPPSTSPGPVRYPKPDFMAASIPQRPGSIPRNPPVSPIRPYLQPAEPNKIKQTGEMLQNLMLRHQGPNFAPMPLGLTASLPQGPGVSPNATPLPSRQRSLGEVTPLRRPLPVEGAMPLKPKRPPFVNLEPYLRFKRVPAIPLPKRNDAPERKTSLPSVAIPPLPPQRSCKPTRLPCQVASIDIEEEKDPYDDIGSFDKNDSDTSLQCAEEEEDVYEFIDEEMDTNSWIAEDKKKQNFRHQEQERKPPLGHHMKMIELRRNFQLQGEIEVLRSTRARHDWSGGSKLDLSVRQGDILEIIRAPNNPAGKCLAHTMNGSYGYISNTCVDSDLKKADPFGLPPPPPDPESQNQDDDDYDDVQPLPDEFPPPPLPPPPLEISIDPKVEKEIRKKFKFEGPLQVQHIMMVDPNCIIKKPGAKELLVTQGEILDVIDSTNSKKYFCRNKFGKYGYVPATFLLPMEGDIYDDVEYLDEVYDNDDPNSGN